MLFEDNILFQYSLFGDFADPDIKIKENNMENFKFKATVEYPITFELELTGEESVEEAKKKILDLADMEFIKTQMSGNIEDVFPVEVDLKFQNLSKENQDKLEVFAINLIDE